MYAVNLEPLKKLVESNSEWQYKPLQFNMDVAKEFIDNYSIQEWVIDYYDSEPYSFDENSEESKEFNNLATKICEHKASKAELKKYKKIYEEYEKERVLICNWQEVENSWLEEDELSKEVLKCFEKAIKDCQLQLNKRVFQMFHDKDSSIIGIFIYLRDIKGQDIAVIFKKKE